MTQTQVGRFVSIVALTSAVVGVSSHVIPSYLPVASGTYEVLCFHVPIAAFVFCVALYWVFRRSVSDGGRQGLFVCAFVVGLQALLILALTIISAKHIAIFDGRHLPL